MPAPWRALTPLTMRSTRHRGIVPIPTSDRSQLVVHGLDRCPGTRGGERALVEGAREPLERERDLGALWPQVLVRQHGVREPLERLAAQVSHGAGERGQRRLYARE